MRRVLLLMVVCLLVGCAHTGRFAKELRFHVESIDFRLDGSFVFSCWFDGGEAHEVTGTWRQDGKKTVVTQVPGLADGERSACIHLHGREIWDYRANAWHRGAEGPYRRTKR